MPRVLRAFRYLWAAPYTLLGLLLGLLAVACGGRVCGVAGVLEFGGGLLGRLARRLPGIRRFPAVTLGHVVLGSDRETLAALRGHEHVHVRQYERWGLLFGPAYLASSLVQLLRGRDPYRANRFEREAYESDVHGVPRA